MIKKYLVLIIVLGMSLTSCEDFLTEMPKHKLVIENAVRDYESAKNIINGMYGVYEKRCGNLGGYIPAYLYSQASLWKYSGSNVQMSYTQSSNNTTGIWQQFYTCINAANAAIQSLSEAPATVFPTDEAKNKLLAEARCFRGFMNLQLLWYFGHWFDDADSPYGIIYRDQLASLTNLMVDRSTVGESYQYILDDFNFAETYLDDYQSSYYMSKQFAQAMHAKMLLVRGWEGDYVEALKLVNYVLNDGPATLIMESDITKLYEDAWDSREVIFAKNLVDVIAESSGQYDTAAWAEYVYSAGLFDVADFEEIPTDWLKADPRYEYIVGEALGPNDWQVTQGKTKTVLTKLYHRGRVMGPNDKYCTYVLRKAELYIMKAELLARTNPGDLAGAIAPINDMRAKYTTPVLDPISTPSSYETLMDAIFKEYVVTLFMENETAWFASIRFQTDGNTWLKKLKGNDISYSENQYCWPIPDDEIIAHSNKIEQNPGLN